MPTPQNDKTHSKMLEGLNWYVRYLNRNFGAFPKVIFRVPFFRKKSFATLSQHSTVSTQFMKLSNILYSINVRRTQACSKHIAREDVWGCSSPSTWRHTPGFERLRKSSTLNHGINSLLFWIYTYIQKTSIHMRWYAVFAE